MSLYVDIRVHDKVVATAAISNISDLANTSDYSVSVTENGYELLGIPSMNEAWMVRGHNRSESVWSLIEKVAKTAAFLQKSRRTRGE